MKVDQRSKAREHLECGYPRSMQEMKAQPPLPLFTREVTKAIAVSPNGRYLPRGLTNMPTFRNPVPQSRGLKFDFERYWKNIKHSTILPYRRQKEHCQLSTIGRNSTLRRHLFTQFLCLSFFSIITGQGFAQKMQLLPDRRSHC